MTYIFQESIRNVDYRGAQPPGPDYIQYMIVHYYDEFDETKGFDFETAKNKGLHKLDVNLAKLILKQDQCLKEISRVKELQAEIDQLKEEVAFEKCGAKKFFSLCPENYDQES